MPRPSASPERYIAFLPLARGILDARLAGFNFGHHLFVPVASIDRAFLSQTAPGTDGQAAFCFPAAGSGIVPARLVLRIIAV